MTRIAPFRIRRSRAASFLPLFRRRSAVSLALLLLAAAALPAAPAQEPLAALQARLARSAAPVAEAAHVGILVVSLESGEPLYEVNADRMFVPASNTKLFVSALALDRLGPERRFETSVLGLRSAGADGRASWDLSLRGGGDPVFSRADLAALARATVAAGVERVDVRLRCDDSYFDSRRLGVGWGATENLPAYQPQVSALAMDRNVVRLFFSPAERPGLPVRVESEFPFPLEVENRSLTVPEGVRRTFSVDRLRGRNTFVVEGHLPVDADRVTVRAAVEEPALVIGWAFRQALARAGAAVSVEPELRVAPPSGRVLAAHASPPLAEILPLYNKPSDNLAGELLLKAVGRARHNDGSTAAGLRELAPFLREIGVEAPPPRLRDGSGLSRMNLISPRATVQLLAAMRDHPHGELWRASLPVAGVDGTLSSRMRNTAAADNVRGKTGTLTGVSALSGTVTTASGEELAFSILTNNHPDAGAALKRMEDEIAVALAEFRR